MNCPHCGARLPSRPRARMLLTGTIFIVAAIVLVLFVRLGVAVLASVLMLVVGTSSFKVAAKGRIANCPSCRRLPVKR